VGREKSTTKYGGNGVGKRIAQSMARKEAMKKTPGTVRELLSSPESWTQGTFARDQDGKSVYPDDPSAMSWCLLGAISYVYHEDSTACQHVNDLILDYYAKKNYRYVPPENRWYVDTVIEDWNDSTERSYKDIAELLKNTGI